MTLTIDTRGYVNWVQHDESHNALVHDWVNEHRHGHGVSLSQLDLVRITPAERTVLGLVQALEDYLALALTDPTVLVDPYTFEHVLVPLGNAITHQLNMPLGRLDGATVSGHVVELLQSAALAAGIDTDDVTTGRQPVEWGHPLIEDWQHEVTEGDTLRSFGAWLADRDGDTEGLIR